MVNENIAVKVKNLDVKFDDFYAVKDISFEVKTGEIFGFLGANGAGKTTTIRVLCGLLSPTRGEIEIAGQKFQEAGSELKMKVGYMSQRFTLYDDMTVDENLNMTGNFHFLTRKKIETRKEELLNFIGWQRNLDTLVKDLPGGQKQQVSLVASMMHDPEIIFLDEPTAGVSPVARARFWELIQMLSHAGKTVFVTTHYMDEAEQCGRIALMRSGELVTVDSPAALKVKTFPNDLIELEPMSDNFHIEINPLKEKLFSLFEPYGMRYHAEWKDNQNNIENEKRLQSLAVVKKIKPSLEDVFIRIVEGRNR